MMNLAGIRKMIVPLVRQSPAEKAIIFGSYARGEADKYSDLDLLIISGSERPFVERYKDYWNIFLRFPGAMEMVVYRPEEFSRMEKEENPFIERVNQEGKVIYEKR